MTDPRQPVDFTGRVAIVTGAGAGMGREIALLLASRGARVVVNDVGRGAAAGVVEEIRQTGGEAVASTEAVGTAGAARAIAASALEAFGRIDVLVNNAGVVVAGSLDELPDEDVDRVLATNLIGPYALMRAAWPAMREQRYGRILNTSSAAVLGVGARGSYAAGKGGLLALTLDAAIDGRPHGILVNALLPTARSQMNTRADPGLDRYLPAAVAPVACYLVSDVVPDGGMVVHTAGGLMARIGYVRHPSTYVAEPTIEAVRDAFPALADPPGVHVLTTTAHHQQLVHAEYSAAAACRAAAT